MPELPEVEFRYVDIAVNLGLVQDLTSPFYFHLFLLLFLFCFLNELSRRQLEETLKGKEIVQVVAMEQGGGPREGQFDDIVFEADSVPHPDVVKKALVSFVLCSVGRKGKNLWWNLGPKAGSKISPTQSVNFHFGMTGAFQIKNVKASAYKSFKVDESKWPPKFTKLEIILKDEASKETRVAFTDPRRLGRIRLRGLDPCQEPPLSLMAPDPVTDLLSESAFSQGLKNHGTAIKAVLLDQNKIVCGIG